MHTGCLTVARSFIFEATKISADVVKHVSWQIRSDESQTH